MYLGVCDVYVDIAVDVDACGCGRRATVTGLRKVRPTTQMCCVDWWNCCLSYVMYVLCIWLLSFWLAWWSATGGWGAAGAHVRRQTGRHQQRVVDHALIDVYIYIYIYIYTHICLYTYIIYNTLLCMLNGQWNPSLFAYLDARPHTLTLCLETCKHRGIAVWGVYRLFIF